VYFKFAKHVVALDQQLANNVCDRIRLLLTPDDKWKGFTGVMSMANVFEEDPNKTDNVLHTIFLLNRQMVEGSRIPFAFFFNRENCILPSTFKSFYIRISSRLANLLGFRYQVVFNKTRKAWYVYDKPPQEKLRQADYCVTYFCEDVQRRENELG
jgi:hypothetical protein